MPENLQLRTLRVVKEVRSCCCVAEYSSPSKRHLILEQKHRGFEPDLRLWDRFARRLDVLFSFLAARRRST